MEQENTTKRRRGRPKGSKNKKKLPVKLEEDKLLQICKISSLLKLTALRKVPIPSGEWEKRGYELEIMKEHIQYQLINLALSLDKEKEEEKEKKAKYMWFILNRPTF